MAEIDVTRIAGNIGAMNSLNSLQNINKQLSVHQTRLATGKRINSAADDPAGLTIATKMFSRSEGLKTALSNIGDAKNLLAVAESGLGRINDILVQMRNKAEAAASDTLGEEERTAILEQMTAFAAQIDDIASQTKWQDKSLIDGSFSATSLSFQTGTDSNDHTDVSGLKNMGATGMANGGSLRIAAKTTSASVAIVGGDAQDLFTDATPPAAPGVANTNLSQLSNGTYRVSMTMTSATAATVHLYDSSGTEMLVSQTPAAGTGAVAEGVNISFNADGTTPYALNFGNGLTVSLVNGKANGSTTTAEVTYTQSGSYTISTDGDGATVLTGSSSAADFRSYMTHLDGKLKEVSSQLSKIGATTGRLSFKEDQISAMQINVEASYNRIMNANMAEEQVNASKYQILQQTATAMLSQANSAPQFLLSLFR